MNSLFSLVFGPTASGKTALAVDLATKESANILSFDSRHVYTDMNIVTGKDIPSGFMPESHPDFPNIRVYRNAETDTLLFGLDLIAPNDEFSISHYYRFAEPILAWHRKHRKKLILVGGSWQYASVLLDPPATLFSEPSKEIRSQNRSLDEMQHEVQTRFFDRWNMLNHSDQNNPRRLIRILETPQTIATKPTPLIADDEYHILLVSDQIDAISKRIQNRVEQRLTDGALDETKQLIEKFPDWSSPAFLATGYGFLRQHLEGSISLVEAKKLWHHQERAYAKRQLTWLKAIEKKYPTHSKKIEAKSSLA